MLSFQQLVNVHSWNTTVLSENMKRASLSAYMKTQLQTAGKIVYLNFVYVIAWVRGQVFPKLPESRCDVENLENCENTSKIAHFRYNKIQS